MNKTDAIERFHAAADEMIAAERAAETAVERSSEALTKKRSTAYSAKAFDANGEYVSSLEALAAALSRRTAAREAFRAAFEAARTAGATGRDLEHEPLERFARAY